VIATTTVSGVAENTKLVRGVFLISKGGDRMDTAKVARDVGYNFSAPFLLAPGGIRIIQIQPTLRCNLRCAHCYTESGPDRHEEISLESLEGFLSEAGSLGYQYVGISGGEPLLWKGLEDFLGFAKGAGFSTSVTTNGTLLDANRAARLYGHVDLFAVSVDGPPEQHAAMRGSQTAFPSMRNGLSALRDAGIPFVLAFTLTRHNADRLRWLYGFADDVGALGVNVHPLCDHGAASINLSDSVPDSIEFKVSAWLLALLMEQRGVGGPAVTLDVIQRTLVEKSCWPMLAKDNDQLRTAPFHDLMPSLIIEPDGCIVPFIYGFPRAWSLGFIGHNSLLASTEAWQARYIVPVAGLIQTTLEQLAGAGAEYVDLFGEILTAAKRLHLPPV